MLRHVWMCHPNGLVFYQKSLDKGLILVKKILTKISVPPKLEKKSAEKTLEMGLDLRIFKKKPLKSAIFECEKSLEMGKGFRPRPRTTHLVKKKEKLSTPPHSQQTGIQSPLNLLP